MKAISINTMGPQVLASPGRMYMNISKCDSMKFNFKRMLDFDPMPVELVAVSSKHTIEADEKVKATVTLNAVNIVEPTELAKESSIDTEPPQMMTWLAHERKTQKSQRMFCM